MLESFLAFTLPPSVAWKRSNPSNAQYNYLNYAFSIILHFSGGCGAALEKNSMMFTTTNSILVCFLGAPHLEYGAYEPVV
jgi:hypothetical protein